MEREMTQLAEREDVFGEAIYSYSRRQAIEDGVLVDVGPELFANPAEREDMPKQAGFQVPVALTYAAWVDCVEWSPEDSKR
jgi:hypothetical protein